MAYIKLTKLRNVSWLNLISTFIYSTFNFDDENYKFYGEIFNVDWFKWTNINPKKMYKKNKEQRNCQ